MNSNLSRLLKTKYGRVAFRPALIAILFLGGAIWAWESAIKEHFIAKRFEIVEAGQIYRSGQISAPMIKKILVGHKIGLIVSLTGDENETDDNAEMLACAELGIDRLVFPLKGNGTGDINYYAEAIAAVCQAKRKQIPVLVHCSAGVQRSGGVIAAYQLLVRKKDPRAVLDEMEYYGFNSKKNEHLLPYLNSNMQELALLLKQRGVIDEVFSPMPQFSLVD
jgi:protein tyrosine/serine phosphatase